MAKRIVLKDYQPLLPAVLNHLTEQRSQAIERLKQLLSVPSVSTDPAYAEGMQRGAQWVAEALNQIGFNASIQQTTGHPLVLACSQDQDVLDAEKRPRVLFYGHYDVQPPDPLDLWVTPPFDPTLRQGAIFARGACDDKGQVCCFLEALRAWKNVHGQFPLPVTVIIEGEEECGSPSLAPFIESHRQELTADIALVSDTMMWNRHTMAITYGLRGLLYFDVKLHHANRDLHSGMYGGTLANPTTMLARVLGKLFDEGNRVTIPGFYDNVEARDEEEQARWRELDFDEMRDFLGPIGVQQPFGEQGYSTLERRWTRPSCDVNGLYGGYSGQGAKTVIPSFAGAKVSFRLAPHQDPEKIARSFEDWLRRQEVSGCRWEISQFGSACPVKMSRHSPYLAAAAHAIEKASGKQPALIREGGTIPVVGQFKRALGLDSLLIGFGLADDRIHAPNEKFELSSFDLGCRTHAILLAELATVAKKQD